MHLKNYYKDFWSWMSSCPSVPRVFIHKRLDGSLQEQDVASFRQISESKGQSEPCLLFTKSWPPNPTSWVCYLLKWLLDLACCLGRMAKTSNITTLSFIKLFRLSKQEKTLKFVLMVFSIEFSKADDTVEDSPQETTLTDPRSWLHSSQALWCFWLLFRWLTFLGPVFALSSEPVNGEFTLRSAFN